jgi:putative Ca2+/H+ antiporter (TMEM165/GDT1 family)
MGDKTQIATVALAARFDDLFAVAAGTTAGMLVADVPVVFLGGMAAGRLPMKLIRSAAASIFLALGVIALLNALNFF